MKYLTVGIIVLAVIIGIVYFLFRQSAFEMASETSVLPMPTEQVPPIIVGTELKIADLKVCEGAEARSGMTVTVHYTGTFTSGVKFDSSYDRCKPFIFTLGQGMVIPGWERGIQGIRVGGKRRLLIPASLAYGSTGSIEGGIPPSTPLVFEVELLAAQ